MKFLYIVDEMILDYIECVCHSIQRTIGMTNFGICWVCLALLVAGEYGYFFFWGRNDFIRIVVVTGACIILSLSLSVAEKVTSGKTGCGNPFRIYIQLARVSQIIFVLIVLISDSLNIVFSGSRDITGILRSTVFVLILYCISCTPLPPAPSRLSEFFSKLKPTSLMEVRPSES